MPRETQDTSEKMENEIRVLQGEFSAALKKNDEEHVAVLRQKLQKKMSQYTEFLSKNNYPSSSGTGASAGDTEKESAEFMEKEISALQNELAEAQKNNDTLKVSSLGRTLQEKMDAYTRYLSVHNYSSSPVTDSSMDAFFIFVSWALGITISATWKEQVRILVKNLDLPRSSVVDLYLGRSSDIIKKAESADPLQRDLQKAVFEMELLEKLRKSSFPIDSCLLSEYYQTYKILVNRDPPLTTKNAMSWIMALDFEYDVASGKEPDPVEKRFENLWGQRLISSYGNAPQNFCESVATSAIQFAKYRIMWSTLPDDKKNEVRLKWREDIQNMELTFKNLEWSNVQSFIQLSSYRQLCNMNNWIWKNMCNTNG